MKQRKVVVVGVLAIGLSAIVLLNTAGGAVKQQPQHSPSVGSGATQASTATSSPAQQAKSNGSGKTGAKTAQIATDVTSADIFYKRQAGKAVNGKGATYPLEKYYAMATPNDPMAMQPWVSQAAVDSAWATPRGSAPTVLAVIDTGVALQHEEFQGRWDYNTGEQGSAATEAPSRLNCTDRHIALNASCNLIDDDGNGVVDDESGSVTDENPSRLNCTDQGKPLAKDCNLIDDDGNGYVDDVNGWDFIHGDNSPQAGESVPHSTMGHHATYVTSIAAANSNNGKGIAGVDNGTKILPVQALDDDGAGDTVSVANAVNYATLRGADVISLSLGGSDPDPFLQQAIDHAIASGVVVVAAAGNDGCDCLSYPGNYPEVVSVGALDTNGQPAYFSSYGANLDIMAPGVNLYTADWSAQNPTSLYASGISGTSLATPIVSGMLTRLKSQQPSDTPQQLIAALMENANKSMLPAAQPRSDMYGFGTLNAGAATQRLAAAYTPAMAYQFTPVSLGNYMNSANPTDKIGTARVVTCPNMVTGSTPVYEMLKGTSSFFTTSAIEKAAAEAQGYTSNVFTYACISQPNDAPGTWRQFNIYKEFNTQPDNF